MYFCSWKFKWFLQKEPIAVQNFRLLTAQAKFHQICTLIGYFCWKHIGKVWRKYVSWYQRVVQNLQKNLFFISKMTRIGWILIRELKSLKNLHFDWSILCKVYHVWSKKVKKSYIWWNWGHAKFEEKLTCGLENDIRNLANFHQNTWKCQNWYFHRILLSKVENVWATTYRGVISNDTEEW